MQIVRKYHRLDWWSFLEYMEKSLANKPNCLQYFEFLDEFRMRSLDSVSEGMSYKLRRPAIDLLMQFEARKTDEVDFCSDVELEEFLKISNLIISGKLE